MVFEKGTEEYTPYKAPATHQLNRNQSNKGEGLLGMEISNGKQLCG